MTENESPSGSTNNNLNRSPQYRANDDQASRGTREILLVDDDKDYRELQRTRLESYGYQVICASSGKEALELLDRQVIPNLIIMDLDMPEKNGLTTLINLTIRQKIKKEAKKIPVVIATGMHSDQIRSTVRTQDVSGYLRKPYGCDQLIKTVKELIG